MGTQLRPNLRQSGLSHVPPGIQNRLRDLHPRPLVGTRKPNGGFWSGRVPRERAWRFPFLQIGNAGPNFAAVVFDCDEPDGLTALADLPLFNWHCQTNWPGAEEAIIEDSQGVS